MAVSQEKISVYNLADLKNTSDDAIPNYLNSLKFRQSHRLTDGRLALGFSALGLALACFAWDYAWGFEATKRLTAAAVAVYTVLNTALTLWQARVERGTVYEGTAPDGRTTVRISTAAPPPPRRGGLPTYDVTVEVTALGGGAGGAKTETLRISRPFTEWFDAAGHFVAAPFQSMLATAVPVIGQFDPKRVAAAEPPASSAYTPEMLDLLAQANASAVGSAAETATGADSAVAAKKGGKRRKA